MGTKFLDLWKDADPGNSRGRACPKEAGGIELNSHSRTPKKQVIFRYIRTHTALTTRK
jgi:hypothetical protein